MVMHKSNSANPFFLKVESKLPAQESVLDHNSLKFLQNGIELQRKRKFLDAERVYQVILRRYPYNADALHLMGTIALEAEEPEIAIEYFVKAVKQNPKNPIYQHNLGNTYLQVRNFELAIRHLTRAIELKPNLVDGLCNLARCYVLMSNAEMALPLYRKAVRLEPGHHLVAVGLGNALVNLGKMEEAETVLRSAIQNRVGLAEAYMALSSSKKFSGNPAELEEILCELENADLAEGQKGSLHHAAGKILDDLKRYEEAVDHFSRAKEISGSSFEIETYRKWVDEMIALFNPHFAGSRQGFGDSSDVPVFVVGMPRSGTTLTEQIMASHPRVHGAGELHKLRHIAVDMGFARHSASKLSQQLMMLTVEQSRTLAGEYLKHLKRYSRTADRIVDKMPHNFELIGLIRLLFPNAKIIHVRRNATDNCVSCFMNAFSEAHGYNADLTKLGLYYREYDRLMRHWNKVFPGKIFVNSYEELIANQEEQSRKLIDHIGLPWDPACFNFHETERTVTTISRWQVRQPIYKSSVQRWKNYGGKLQPLLDSLGDLASAE
jgi:tetratricopeptide (TPR) repeat protein